MIRSRESQVATPVVLAEFDPRLGHELVRMWRESFDAGVGGVDPHPIGEQYDYLMREVISGNAVRIALGDGRLVGFVVATRESISQLYVRTSEQRRGIGSQLLGWAKAQSGSGSGRRAGRTDIMAACVGPPANQ